MRVLFTIVLIILLTAALSAQTSPEGAQTPQTREEALRQQREAKATALAPSKSDGLQRALTRTEQIAVFLTARERLYPKIGSLATGSGFAFGVGYGTRAPFAGYGLLDTFAAASVSKYWALETRAIFPNLAGGRIAAEAVGSLREYPHENFYGLGPDSQRADETSFLLRTARVGGSAGVKPAPWATVGGGVDYLKHRVGRGRQSPSIEELFSVEEVPGLGAGADFVRTSVFAELDYREPKNARQGGYYHIERSHYDDRTTGAFTFNRTDVELRQYLGFLAGRRVIVVRGLYSTTDAADGREVPFYLMPWLGGKDTHRGFRNYRFRAPHSLLLQAEYRWEIWSALEGALFYDSGMVANTRRDFKLKSMERAYGFGFRFNTDEAVVMRVDAAFGSRDGKRLFIVVGGFF